MRLWTKEEDDFLRENYHKKSAFSCAIELRRSRKAVFKRARTIGIAFSIKHSKHAFYDFDILSNYIKTSQCKKEVLEKMGLRAAGGNYKVLDKYLRLYNLDISHFDSYEIQREVLKKYRKKRKRPLKEILVENSTYENGNNLKKRLYDGGLKQRKCELCGQGEEWNGMKISLILDHINGVHSDNRLENLRIVCPNCNAGLDTFAGKNIKNKNKGKEKQIYYCKCGNVKLEKRSKCCRSCFYLMRRKTTRPNKEHLINLLQTLPLIKIGKQFNVSDNAVRKWCKYYKINNKELSPFSHSGVA